jgi:hypothetical protein
VVTGSLQASYKGAVRKYGFEGEARREGEGTTRTTESSYRRKLRLAHKKASPRRRFFQIEMFSIMHLVLFGVLKIEKNPDHDVIRIFLPSLEPVFIYLWRVLRGVGLLAALRAAC